MKKKLFGIVLGIFALAFLYFSVAFIGYFHRQNENKNMIEYCSQNNTDECFTRMFELLLPKMLIHNAWIDGVEIDLVKLDYTSRVDSANALHKAENLIGYGVFKDVVYETEYSRLFNNYSYAFDCGVTDFDTGDKLCKFYSECIASDEFLITNQLSSGKVHTLEQKLKELNLWDKKVFVKMDVAEADTIALPEIIKNADKITGFNIGLHVRTPKSLIEKINLLDEINEKFVLVSRNTLFLDNSTNERIIHSKYYKEMINHGVFYLSFINKDMVDKYVISNIQNTDKYYKKKKVSRLFYTEQIPLSDVAYVVTLTEKIKEFFKGNKV